MRKGFTLIELLAVIVILAIILVIAVPQILKVIEDARLSAYIDNENILVRTAKIYTASNIDSLPINVGDTKMVSIAVLKNKGLITSIKNSTDNSECEGNILIKKISNNGYIYTPYLSCGTNYESEEYTKNGLIANYKLDGNANDSTKLSSNGTISGAYNTINRKSLNLLNNGNFAVDTNGDGKADNWIFSNITNSSMSNNIQKGTCNLSSGCYIGYSYNNIIGHIYHYRIDVKSNSSLVNLNNGLSIVSHTGSNNFETLSWRDTATATSVPHRSIYDYRASGWTEIQLKNAQYYDLTAIFGAGNEPSKQWCDSNLNTNFSKAYGFDGIDDYIELPDSQNLRMTTGGTITAWIYPLSLGENGYGRIVDKSTGTGGNNGYFISLYTNNSLDFQINASGVTLISANNSITLNSWNYIAVTFNSSGQNMYINGVLSTSNTSSTLPPNVAGIVRIGNLATATDRTFNGSIDDVRFYNRVLSADEIKNNYDIEK